MHDPQRCVAGSYVLNLHAQRTQIIEFADRKIFLLHLSPDAVNVLRPSRDFSIDAVLGQRFAQLNQ